MIQEQPHESARCSAFDQVKVTDGLRVHPGAVLKLQILFQNTMLEMGMIHVSQSNPYSAITPFAAF